MADKTDKLQQEPAEGSREVIERELANDKQSGGKRGDDDRRRPEKGANER